MENEKKEEFKVVKSGNSSAWPILIIIFISFIIIVLSMLLGISIYNTSNNSIVSGIFIKGVNVSGLTKQEAIYKVRDYLQGAMPNEVKLKHGEYETSINRTQINADFNIEAAVDAAYRIGREGNIITDTIEIIKTMVSNIDIQPDLQMNQEELKKILEDISTKLPDTVIQSSYYIEDNNLIVTKGKEGNIVDVEHTTNRIKELLENLEYQHQKIEIITQIAKPQEINIEEIHSEIYKEAIDAYYTTNPFVVHPHENGVDFKMSIEEAKMLLQEDKEEYSIPLKVIKPKVTTNMIGNEAFPDLISSFSTKYSASNRDRTTNLKLASDKINGTVIMPGEIFSYNTVVGKRTIAAGYKEAPIYENGKVVDGLGGGICQISTTLYNAALYANLEIVERRNHQFVPSYSAAGRDATVVYGAIDFKFKNTRSYPIKIICSVQGGIAKFELFGLHEQNEYEVEVSSQVVSRTATSLKSVTYQTVKQNGQVIRSGIINRDTYKRH